VAANRGEPGGTAPSQPHPWELPGTPVVPASSNGYLPSSWSVSPTGQFDYGIPLSVPAGREGMQPSLVLSYSSSGGSELVGVGWSLSGAGSTITRCGRSLSTEGRVDGVDFSASDRFCLDGQKLIAVGGVDYGSGQYGDIDTQYRTEADTFAQIVSTGPKTLDGKGPEQFIVRTKAGHRLTYNAVEAMRISTTVDGTVTPVGTVRVQWLLASEEDRAGNAVTYEYNPWMQGSDQNAASYALDIRLIRIRYTSNASTHKPSYRYVEITYEDRPAIEKSAEPRWNSGIAYTMPARIKTISMYAPNPTATSKVWQYNLTYEQSVATNRSLLKTVQQCSSIGGCAWLKQFDWIATAATPEFMTFPTLAAPLYANYDDPSSNAQESPTAQVLDLNGDGAQDLMYHPGSIVFDFTVPNHALLGKRSALGGNFVPLGEGPYNIERNDTSNYGNLRLGSSYPIDLDGDGKVELFSQIESARKDIPCSWWTERWNDATKKFERSAPGINCDLVGFHSVGPPYDDPIYRFPRVLFGDLNGDGLVDLIEAVNVDPNSPELGLYNPQWMVSFNGNNGHAGSLGPDQLTGKPFANGKPNGLPAKCAARMTDMDGNGRGDFVTARVGYIGATHDNCTQVGTALSSSDGGTLKTHDSSTAPVNQPVPVVDWGKQSFSTVSDSTFFGDFNGDGLEDYAVIGSPNQGDPDPGPVNGSIFWNSGNGYYKSGRLFVVPLDAHPDQAHGIRSTFADRGIRVLDINRDGRADIVTFHNTPTPMITMLLSRGNGTFQSVDMPVSAGTRLDGKRNVGAFPHFNSADQAWYGYDPSDMPGLAGGWSLAQTGDFNGDGFSDIVRHIGGVNGGFEVLQQKEQFNDRLAAVYDQKTVWPREEIRYSSEWSNNPLGKMKYQCSYPLHCTRSGLTVVRSVTSRTNLVDPGTAQQVADGGRTVYYSYEDPVSDAQHGFLGFSEFTVWDPAQPSQTTSHFDQRTRLDVSDNPNNTLDKTGSFYPYAGMPQSVTTIVPILTQEQVDAQSVSKANARITQTTHKYNFKRLNGGATHIVLPDLDNVDVWEFPVKIAWTIGTATPYHLFGYTTAPAVPALSSYTYQQFDNYGNLTFKDGRSTSNHTSGGSIGEYVSLSATFENRVDAWQIGLPLLQVMTSKVADPTTPSRARRAQYHHNSLGQLDTIWIEKGGSIDVASTTTLTYFAMGQLRSGTTMVANEAPRTNHVEYEVTYPGAPPEQIYPSQLWFEHINPDCPAAVDCRPSSWLAVHPVYGVVSTMDANGAQSTLTYDGLGRTVGAHTDGEQKISINYAGRRDLFGGINGMIQTTTVGSDPRALTGQQVKAISDARGNVLSNSIKGFDGKQINTDTRYDLIGRLISTTRPYPAGLFSAYGSTLNRYDSLGRVISTRLPDGNTVTHTYPTLFESHRMDAGNNGTINENYTISDVDGHLTTSASILTKPNAPPETIKTQFTYGVFGTVEAVWDGAYVTRMTYDGMGRQVRTEEPDRGISTTAYNGFGEIRQSDSLSLAGQTRTLVHDDLGRVVLQITPDGTASFSYDTSAHGVGQLDKVTSADKIVTAYRYDNLGRAAGMDLLDDVQRSYSVDMSYDAQTGRLATLAYPQVPGRPRFTTQYHYNMFGFLDEVDDATPSQPVAPLWRVDARNADFALLDGTLGNGAIAVHRDYDAMMGRLANQSATHSGSNVHSVGYGYWQNGLVKSRISNDGVAKRTEAFDYDSLLRLTQWKFASTDPGGPPQIGIPTHFKYDFTGNLTDITKNGALIEHRTYGKSNGTQPHTLTNLKTYLGANVQSNVTYDYDALGRMGQDANRKITYTGFDLPKTLTRNGQTWNLLYDATGQRIAKAGPDGSTRYVPGLYERREVGTSIKHVFHVSGTDGTVAQVNYDEPKAPAVTGVTTILYPLDDALGSTSVVADANGSIIERDYYDPFGQRINANGSTLSVAPNNSIKEGFTGQEHDDAFGLINFKGRMYDPAMKRFLSADPMVSAPAFSQSWNPYSYVLNSPLNLTDPSGFNWYCGATISTNGGPDVSMLCEGDDPSVHNKAMQQDINKSMLDADRRDAKQDAHSNPARSDDAGSNWLQHESALLAGSASSYEANVHYNRELALDLDRGNSTGFDRFVRAANAHEPGNGAANLGLIIADWLRTGVPPNGPELKVALNGAAEVVKQTAPLLAPPVVPDATTSTIVRGSEGPDIRDAVVVRDIKHGERIVDVLNEVASLTISEDLEHSVGSLADGRRAILSGGRDGIDFKSVDLRRLILHSHGPNSVSGPSTEDISMIRYYSQRSSWLLEVPGGKDPSKLSRFKDPEHKASVPVGSIRVDP
jgi:RHS repeat-associated protein